MDSSHRVSNNPLAHIPNNYPNQQQNKKKKALHNGTKAGKNRKKTRQCIKEKIILLIVFIDHNKSINKDFKL